VQSSAETMPSWFGSRPKSPPKTEMATETAEVIADLQDKIKLLEKKTTQLDKKVQQHTRDALACKQAGDKQGALVHLRRRKDVAKEIESAQSMSLTLEQEVLALGGAVLRMAVVEGLRRGRDQLAKLHAKMDADGVDDLMAEFEELRAEGEEIDAAFKRASGFGELEEDDDLADEFEALGMEERHLAVPDAPPVHTRLAHADAAAAKEAAGERAVAKDEAEAEAAAMRDALPRPPSDRPAEARAVDLDADAAELAELEDLEASMMTTAT